MKLLSKINQAQNLVANLAFKVPEVAVDVGSKVAGVAQRNPLTAAALTGGASLLPTLLTQRGRSALLGKKSVAQQTLRFVQRHPYVTAPLTGGASLIAAGTTKRGRQALAFKKPGYRTAPGLTGAEKKAFLDLKNKGKLTPVEQIKKDELQKKGEAKIAADKVSAEEKAAASSGGGGGSTGGGGGGGSSGGGSSEGGGEESPPEEKPSALGPILLAGGLAALMFL